MKLHFEPNLDYQLQAIKAVCGLFHGQETCRTEFTVTRDAAGGQQSYLTNDLGIGNRLTLLDDELLINLHAIQLRHGLAPSPALTSGDFTVEMETGTGKTYVYLRTIFELNKRYGFTKFVIVVPSVAIKEGVYHTIETAAEHLRGIYAGTPFDFFLYDSVKLGQVRNFATSPQIQIMVMTVGAIINRAKRMALVDGIKYERIGPDDFYVQQLFESEELTGYLKSMVNVRLGIHEQVIYQSDTERTFAENLDKNEAVNVFAKLPSWIKVPTPLGAYNPDWAVLVKGTAPNASISSSKPKTPYIPATCAPSKRARSRAAKHISKHWRFMSLRLDTPSPAPLVMLWTRYNHD